VDGLTTRNVQLQLETGDGRPAVVFDDVKDATVDQLDAAPPTGAAALLHLTDVEGAFVRGCRPEAGTGLFVKVEGARSKAVMIAGNDLGGAEKVYEAGSEVDTRAVFEMMNRFNINRSQKGEQ
jgi:hypothetical protein